MEELLDLLIPLFNLVSIAVLIVLFFVFIVHPLLNYLIINREIERNKEINDEITKAYSLRINTTSDSSEDTFSLPKVEGVDAGIGNMSDERSQQLNNSNSSDTDKAVDMVKQWVHTDSPR